MSSWLWKATLRLVASLAYTPIASQPAESPAPLRSTPDMDGLTTDAPCSAAAHAVIATADAIYALAGTGHDGKKILMAPLDR